MPASRRWLAAYRALLQAQYNLVVLSCTTSGVRAHAANVAFGPQKPRAWNSRARHRLVGRNRVARLSPPACRDPRLRHPHQPAPAVQERASRGAGVEAGVGLDQVEVRTTVLCVLSQRAPTHEHVGVADGRDLPAQPQVLFASPPRSGQPMASPTLRAARSLDMPQEPHWKVGAVELHSTDLWTDPEAGDVVVTAEVARLVYTAREKRAAPTRRIARVFALSSSSSPEAGAPVLVPLQRWQASLRPASGLPSRSAWLQRVSCLSS